MMTPSSYSACLRYWSVTPFGNRWCSPRSTSLTSHDSSVSPSGTGARGMRSCPSVNPTSTRSAISSVLSQASGNCGSHCARISAGDLR